MSQYIFRRIVLLVPTLLVLSVFVFGMVRFVPGDVLTILLAEQKLAATDRQHLAKQLGLDKPIPIQYAQWVGGATHGDLGRSLFTGHPVRDDIFEKFLVTMRLAILAVLISLCLAIPIGVLSAVSQDSLLDYLSRSFAVFGLSMPVFWVATMVVVYGSILWRYSPPLRYTGFSDDPIQSIQELLLPALVLGLAFSAGLVRMIRTMLLEVLRQDFIRTARAKGLRGRAVIMRHALRNALVPVVTVFGLQVAGLLGGTVITESVFNIPGSGRLLVSAVTLRDYPVIQGIALFQCLIVLTINLIVDLSYGVLDPRIRFA
ncbi:MAG: ABC transporter permease [Dehalococcoidia bacterium]